MTENMMIRQLTGDELLAVAGGQRKEADASRYEVHTLLGFDFITTAVDTQTGCWAVAFGGGLGTLFTGCPGGPVKANFR